MRKLISLAALAAAATYFFDPQNGKRRRNMARDRTAALFRRLGRRGERAGRAVAAEATGLAAKAQHLQEEEKPQPDDVTLARKVESELFRDEDVPKGRINVNAENGKIVIRGEVDRPEMISELEERVRKVQGVQGVENLLHVPGTPAPTHE
jgi:osmotically-inducible protein OsmY